MGAVNHISTAWPTSTDYTEAVQSPASFRVGELAALAPVRSMMGVPTAATGQNAVVFLVADAAGSRHALRCFTSAPTDGRSRYLGLDQHVRSLGGSTTIAGVRWIDDGIQLNGIDWPVVLMPWIEGRRLDSAVEHLLDAGNGDGLRRLADNIEAAVHRLQQTGIAHGDLQHGNVLVDDDLSVTLVDLDGVWVSSASLAPPAELGHPNYQHPDRSAATWGPFVDSFSALLIDVSLRALAADHSLVDCMGGENLVFLRADLEDPHAEIWSRLASNPDETVREGTQRLRVLVSERVENTMVPLHQIRSQPSPEPDPPVTAAAPTAEVNLAGANWWDYDDGSSPSEQSPPGHARMPSEVSASAAVTQSADSGGYVPESSGSRLLSAPIIGALAGAVAGILGSLLFGLLEPGVPAEARSAVFLVLVSGLVGAVVLGWNGLVGGRLGRALSEATLGFGLASVASVAALPIAHLLVTGAINDEREAVAAQQVDTRPTDIDFVDVPLLELTASWVLVAALVGIALGIRLSWRAGLFGGLAGAAAGLVGGLVHASAGASVFENRLLVQPLEVSTLLATGLVTALIAAAVALARRSGALAVLTVMEGRLSGAEVLLRKDSTIGTAGKSTLVLEGPGVLPEHARLRVDGGGARLTAVGAMEVNGQPVVPNPDASLPLASGDVVRVGASYVRFTRSAG